MSTLMPKNEVEAVISYAVGHDLTLKSWEDRKANQEQSLQALAASGATVTQLGMVAAKLAATVKVCNLLRCYRAEADQVSGCHTYHSPNVIRAFNVYVPAVAKIKEAIAEWEAIEESQGV